MQIGLTISTSTLGDNTDADNRRFAGAVRKALYREFASADLVQVSCQHEPDDCFVTDDPVGDVEERVWEIVNDIWDRADY